MPTVALLAAGRLLHFELAVAYEIFGNPPLGAENAWYDVRLCGRVSVKNVKGRLNRTPRPWSP